MVYNFNKLVEEQQEIIAKLLKKNDRVSAEIQSCPKCKNIDLHVFQCSSGIWEIWGKCTACGHIFCMGTE